MRDEQARAVRIQPRRRLAVPASLAVLLLGLVPGAFAPAWGQAPTPGPGAEAPVQSASLAGRVEPGSVGNEVTITVRNLDAEAAIEVVDLELAARPGWLTNVRIDPDGRGPLASGASRSFRVRFDVLQEASPGETGTLSLRVVSDEDVMLDDPNPRLALTVAAGAMVSGAALQVCALRDDAPEGLEADRILEHCDPSRSPVLIWDRVAVFFTPAPDLRRSFVWRIVDPDGRQVQSGSYSGRASQEGPAGAPGAVAALLPRRAGHRSFGLLRVPTRHLPGTYTVQTANARSEPGLFGQQPFLLQDGEWVDGTSFELHDAKLHFQGFVTEPVRDVNLPAAPGLWHGTWTLGPPEVRPDSHVTLDMSAVWRRAVDRSGTPMREAQEQRARSTLTLQLPREIDPAAEEMGQIEVDLERHEAGWGPGTERYFFTAGMHLLVPTTTRPPERSLIESRAAPLAAPRREFRDRWEFDRRSGSGTWFWDQQYGPRGEWTQVISGTGTLLSGWPTDAIGEPARPLAAHLHDPDTIWVLPVFVNLVNATRSDRASFKATAYAYAIYRAEPGSYEGPPPAGGPDAGPDAPGGPPGDLAERPPDPRGAEADEGPGTQITALDPRDPDIARHIRQWIAVAEPPIRGGNARYDEWGRVVGRVPGGVITATARPDDVGARTSAEYVWGKRDHLDSLDHCTLGTYVTRQLGGQSLADCAGAGLPPVGEAFAAADLVGRRLGEAVPLVTTAGLGPRPQAGPPAPTPDLAGTVASARQQGTDVLVEVYTVPIAAALVPDVTNRPLREAHAAVTGAGLKPVVEIGADAPTPAAAGTIARQSPPAGTEIAPGGAVVLTVYGPATAGRTVPSLVGRRLGEAKTALESRELVIAPILEGTAPSAAEAERVHRQDPAPQTEIPPGTTVRVWVYGRYAAPEPPAPPRTDARTPPPQQPVPSPREREPAAARKVLVRGAPEFPKGTTAERVNEDSRGYERHTSTLSSGSAVIEYRAQRGHQYDLQGTVTFEEPPARIELDTEESRTVRLKARADFSGETTCCYLGLWVRYSAQSAYGRQFSNRDIRIQTTRPWFHSVGKRPDYRGWEREFFEGDAREEIDAELHVAPGQTTGFAIVVSVQGGGGWLSVRYPYTLVEEPGAAPEPPAPPSARPGGARSGPQEPPSPAAARPPSSQPPGRAVASGPLAFIPQVGSPWLRQTAPHWARI
jgi:beta-lactam-binding protein with PASTA domain